MKKRLVFVIVCAFLVLSCSSSSSKPADTDIAAGDTDSAAVTEGTDTLSDADTAVNDEAVNDTATETGDEAVTEGDEIVNDADLVNAWDNYTFTKGTLDACSGKIAYQKWEYSGTADAVVVFANGRTEYTDKYHHLIDMFKKPWTIIMYDHYGQGRSEGTRAHADDIDTQLVCDLKKIVDEVAPKALPVAIMAHSMGGFVATRFAENYPDAAKVFAFSSPMYAMKLPYPEETVRAMAETNVKNGNGAVESQKEDPRPACDTNNVTHDCDLYNKFKDDPLTIIGNPTWGWFDTTFKTQDKMIADAAKVTKPMLIMSAGQDTVVLPEKEQSFCDAVNAATAGICTISTYANDYHELFNELDRVDVMKQAIDFIDAGLKK